MNFPLRNIELNVSDETLQEAERLIGNNRVRKIEALDNNLWISEVQDDSIYEVEVMLSGKNVKATTCDCAKTSEKSICKHIAATLLIILARNKAKQEATPAPKAVDRTPKKLTTTAILNQVSAEDLKDFLRKYARNNKDFSLTLKARFAGQVKTQSDIEKYDALVLLCINDVSKNSRRISLRGMRRILSLLQELNDQVEKHIVTENFIEAFQICKSIFNNVIPVLQRDAEGKAELNTVLSRHFLSFKDLSVSKIPPALSEQIWDYTSKRFLASLFYTYEIPDQFLSILQILGNTKIRQSQLIKLIDEALLEGTLLEHTNVNLIATKIAFLEKLDREDEIEEVVNDNLAHTDILILAVENALRNQDLNRSKLLAKMGLDREIYPEQKAQLEEYLLEISVLENDMKSTYHYSICRFNNTYDFNFFKAAKQAAGDRWKEKRDDLITHFRMGKFSLDKRNMIAKIYAKEKMFDDLIDYIDNIRSLDLLQLYDKKLFSHNSKATKSLYLEIIESFLKSHIGRQNSQKIRSAILHLDNQSQQVLGKKIVKLCRSEFSERHSLMEELADL